MFVLCAICFGLHKVVYQQLLIWSSWLFEECTYIIGLVTSKTDGISILLILIINVLKTVHCKSSVFD